MMKKMAKSVVVGILGWQVRRLQKKKNFKTIAVVGSIGKTSTKFAISQVIGTKLNVRFQEGNYNDIVSVPLVFFGSSMPSLLNPIAWLRIFASNERQLRTDYPFDVVVVELGTDGPGQIAEFKRYLKVDIAVVTAIVPEHMEYFADLHEVAVEELSVTSFSSQLLINIDLCASEYLSVIPDYKTYGKNKPADYKLRDITFNGENGELSITRDNEAWLKAVHSSFAEPQLYSLAAAAAVADNLQLPPDEIAKGFGAIKPVAGRMQRLKGIKNSVIIDDSYNASPEATKAALDTLYRINAPHKIALLGNMNELGEYSHEAHSEIGRYCDPSRLDAILTLGPDANSYLADAAEKSDCKVVRFDSPYDAGGWLKENIKEGALILIKGSQNKVFSEEAIKSILANSSDESRLVRQSSKWLELKSQQFKKVK